MAAVTVLVIGGGVIGLSSAVALLRAGYRVHVVAADGGSGAGPSGTPTGILMPTDGRPLATQAQRDRMAAFDLLPQWFAWLSDAAGGDVGYKPMSVLRLAPQPDTELVGSGDWITRDALTAALGFSPPADRGWALPLPGAHLSTSLLLPALRRVIANFGGEITTQPVEALMQSGGRVYGACLADGRQLLADHVVLAAGLGAQPLLTALGVPVTMRGVGGQVLQVRAPRLPRTLVHFDDFTMVPKADGSLWVTGIQREEDTAPRFTDEDRAKLFKQARLLLGPETIVGDEWAGVRPRISGPTSPIIDRAEGWEGLTLALGHGGNGILLSAWTAERVLSLVAYG